MVDVYATMAGGLTACFKSARDIRAEGIKFATYTPDFAWSDTKAKTPDFTITHTDGPAYITVKGSDVAVQSPQGEGLPDDVHHLLYGMVRKALSERGLSCVHATCVGDANGYYLLVGHSGAGKTTLAQNLSVRHGMSLFSGDKTVVDIGPDGSMRAVSGTKVMTRVDAQFNRHAYMLPESAYTKDGAAHIKGIFIVRINAGVDEAQTLSPMSALHTLYPYFLDSVNANIVINGRDVFNGQGDDAALQALAAGLSAACRSIPVRKISGSIDAMTQKVLQP